jgi:hypothetical protein
MEEFVYIDRKKYNNVYVAIEEYVSNSTSCYIGGYLAGNLLLKKPRDYLCFQYVIYSINGFKDYINLCNTIDGKIDSCYLVVGKTLVDRIKFRIFVDDREMCTILSVVSNKNKDGKIVSPVSSYSVVDSYEGFNLKLVDKFMLLHELFSILCDLRLYDDWNNVFELIVSITVSIETNNKKESKVRISKHFTSTINNLQTNGIYFVGESGICKTIRENMYEPISSDKITIISDLSDEKIAEIIGDGCKFSTEIIRVTGDHRIMRTKFSIGGEDIVYKYNMLDYSVVGIVKVDNVKIANIFCCIKFVLLNICNMTWASKIGRLNVATIDKHIKYYKNIFMDEILSSINNVVDYMLFYCSEYVGTHLDEMRDFKLNQTRGSKRDYKPKLYHLAKGTYLNF